MTASLRFALAAKITVLALITALMGAYAIASPTTDELLPAAFTSAQATRGQATFDAQCAACHGLKMDGGPGYWSPARPIGMTFVLPRLMELA